jgi:formylglycine-generating enzyme required for sulfatase activity
MAQPSRYTQVPRSTFWLLPETEALGAFYIGTTPITNEQYGAYDPSYRPGSGSPGPNHAAMGISFDDAVAYCAWYGKLANKPIRLPSEAEWNYACRGASTARFFFGDSPREADAFLWDAESSGGVAHEVEQKRRSPTGLYDMLGLCWEWTSSTEGGGRVLRGGSYLTPRHEMSSSIRRTLPASSRLPDVGFRIVRSL